MKLPSLYITGSGQPFVWMHGMLNSVESDSLYSLINFNRLAELVSVVRYDTCNKSATGDYSWDAATGELLRMADVQNYDSMILAGCSMGSGTAIHAAVRFPERVKALILVTPPPAWEMRAHIKTIYNKIAAKADRDTIPEFLKRLIGQNQDPPEYFEQQHPGTRQQLLAHRLSFDPRYYSQIYRGGAASDLPDRQLIAKIKVPTLIVAQLNDENHPFEMAQQIHSLLKSSELVTVSDYSEYLNFQEKVSNFVRLVTSDNKS